METTARKVLQRIKELGQDKPSIQKCACMTLFNTLRWSATQTHLWHFQTEILAEHKTLNSYYEEIINLMDSFIETYIGHYGRPSTQPFNFKLEDYKEPFNNQEGNQIYNHLKEVFIVIDTIRQNEKVRDLSDLKNIIDEIDAFVNKTKYLLTLS